MTTPTTIFRSMSGNLQKGSSPLLPTSTARVRSCVMEEKGRSSSGKPQGAFALVAEKTRVCEPDAQVGVFLHVAQFVISSLKRSQTYKKLIR